MKIQTERNIVAAMYIIIVIAYGAYSVALRDWGGLLGWLNAGWFAVLLYFEERKQGRNDARTSATEFFAQHFR